MKTLAGIAALLLAVGINPIAAGASTTESAVESDGDTSDIHPSLCDAVPGNLVRNSDRVSLFLRDHRTGSCQREVWC